MVTEIDFSSADSFSFTIYLITVVVEIYFPKGVSRPGMGYLPRPMGQDAHFIIFIFVLIKHVICVLVLDYCTCFIANDLGDIVIAKFMFSS